MLPVPGAMRPLLTWLGPGSHQLHVDDMFGHPGGAPWSGTNYGGNQPSPAQGFAQPNAGFAQPQGYGSTPAPRRNSPSGYQEAMIFLVRFLARRNWAPFTGDRKFHGIELWSARHGGKVGGTLERFWIDRFLHESAQYIEGPRCLEWGIYYLNRFPGCAKKYDVKYEPVHEGKRTAG